MALQRVASIEVAVSKRALTQTGRDRENVSTTRRISIPGSVGKPCAAGEVVCFPRGVEKPCVDADGGGVSAGGGADHAVRDSRRVYDEGTGRAIHPATVTTLHVGTGQRAYATVNANGRYTIGSLSPGTYTVRAEAPGYRMRETTLLELAVAGKAELRIPLRLF